MYEAGPDTRALILIVEDEVLVRMSIADVLDDAGYKVIEAANADEALRVLAAVPEVQAVITDVEMPQGSMDGFALARKVRETRQGLGVLIASGRMAPAPGELPEGAYFVAKPVHPRTLVQLLKTLLNG
jgi:CheY-like chemotaxis protein